MNCLEALALLDDHIDGELDPLQDRAVRQHLKTCAECRREAESVRTLVEAARRLPESIEPRRDLWPGIAPRLASNSGRRAWPLAAIAASLLVVLLGGIYFLLPSGRTPVAESSGGSPAATQVVTHGLQDSTNLDAAEQAFAEARLTLRAALEQQRGSLSPETLSMVDKNVELIEDAIGEIRAALAKDPANLDLNRMLVAYHYRELELLKRVTRHASAL